MKRPKFMNNAIRLAKGEPINLDERIEELENKVNIKLSNFEDSLQTLQQTIMNLHNENTMLREENGKMTKTLAERMGEGSLSLLGGFKEKIIQPILKEGEEFADIMLNNEDDRCPGIKPEQNKPKTYDKCSERASNYKKLKSNFTKPKINELRSSSSKSKTLTDTELKLDPPGPKFASKINERSEYKDNNTKAKNTINEQSETKSKTFNNSDPLAQPSLTPQLEIERDALDPKTKTVKWMRQKFGLPANIQEKRIKSKSRKYKR